MASFGFGYQLGYSMHFSKKNILKWRSLHHINFFLEKVGNATDTLNTLDRDTSVVQHIYHFLNWVYHTKDRAAVTSLLVTNWPAMKDWTQEHSTSDDNPTHKESFQSCRPQPILYD
jgi:hypothetical protein